MPIRLRLALASALVTLVLLAVGGILFLRSFRGGLVDSLDQGLAPQAATLRRAFQSDQLSLRTEGNVPTEELVAQLFDRSGRVVESTREAGRAPVVPPDIVRRALKDRTFTESDVGHEPEPYRILADPATKPGPGRRVERVLVVGTSLEETNIAVADVRLSLLIGGPIAVVLTGVGAWFLAGAALGPVERMRRQADAISDRDPNARLNVPRSRDEIARLGKTMNRMLGRLQAALSRQRNFVADASHELRTPLAVLKTELELAARPGRSGDELRDAIAHATVETERMSLLANDLLFLARSDVGQTPTDRTMQNVVAAVERSTTVFRVRAAEAGVTLEVDGDPTLRAALDSDLLRHALDNLLDNALRYAPRGSTVSVAARAAGPRTITIEVADRGPGFPRSFLPHAFERFRRADQGRARDDGGTGLGLAMVLAVAEAHGGTAIAANRPEGGAMVTLRLPTEAVLVDALDGSASRQPA